MQATTRRTPLDRRQEIGVHTILLYRTAHGDGMGQDCVVRAQNKAGARQDRVRQYRAVECTIGQDRTERNGASAEGRKEGRK